MDDPSALDRLPITFQALTDYFSKLREANPFVLRKETFLRIERVTERHLFTISTKVMDGASIEERPVNWG